MTVNVPFIVTMINVAFVTIFTSDNQAVVSKLVVTSDTMTPNVYYQWVAPVAITVMANFLDGW